MGDKYLKILLIEDNPGDVRLIREMLAEARNVRFKLEHADRLASGVARLAKGNIDLILLDLCLPDSDGLDTFIKVNAEASEVPMVLLTALDDEPLAHETIQAGAQDYLVKGQFESDSLERTIRHAIERHRLVTERMRTEEALRQSEKEYHKLVDNALVGIYKSNLKGDILYANQAIARMFEFDTPEELISEGATARYKNLKDQTMFFNKLKQTGRIENIELEGMTKTGATRHVLVSAVLDGEVFEGMIVDITEHRQAEQAVRESEERYRFLYNNTPSMLHSIDRNSRLVSVSNYWLDILGYERDEVIGRKVTDFMTEASRRYAEEVALPEFFKIGLAKDVPYQFVKKNGEVIDVLVSAIAERDAAGEIKRTLVVLNDITERKKTQEALKQSQERLQAFVNALPDLAFILDEDGRHVEVLTGRQNLLRTSSDQMKSRLLHDVLPEKVADELLAMIQHTLDIGQPQILEYTLDVPAGQRWFEGRTSPLRQGSDNDNMVVLVSRDITERKQAEAELQQRATQLALINDIGSRIAAVLELDSLLDRTARLVQESFDYHHVALFMTDGEVLKLKAVTSLYEPIPASHTQQLNQGINGWVATHGEKIVANDVSTEPRYTFLIAEHSITQSELCLPIKVAGQTVGVLDIQSPYLNAFGENDIIAMEALTGQIAAAISNAWFYEQVQQEITEREQAEIALRENEERFRRVITSITDHVYAYQVAADGQRFMQYLSPNVEEFTGYPIESFIVDWSFWPTVVIHEDDREAAATQADRLAQGEASQTEYRLVRADGEIIWVRDSARVEISPTAKIIYGVVSNITERKQHEHELEVIVTMITALRAAITRADMLPIILDTLLDLLSVDSAALDMYDPLNGETVLELGRGAWVNAVGLRTPLGEGISGHVLTTDQIYFTNQVQNDPRLVDSNLLDGLQAVACVPLIDQEQPIGTLWIGRKYEITPYDVQLLIPIGDIAANALHRAILLEELQRSNKALTQERISLAQRVEERTAELSAANAELARAARLKDEFLANMSHELRTPLNAILGMSEVLRSNVYGLLNEEQLGALSHIEEGGRHLLALVNDILDLSKIEADKLDLVIGPIQVDDVCQASLLFIKQMAQKKRIKVLSTFDDSVETLYADQRRLKQILVNLLNNAVKFTPEGGQIGLEVKGDPVQQVVHFTVWDTGIGVSQKDIDRLFQPFVQLDSSLNRRHEGTGLGLSLVSRLADMHNGRVSLESEVGAGSRFTVSLPWQNERNAAEEQGGKEAEEISDIPPDAPGHPRTILLAEDNETNIIMMRDILRSKGYQIIVTRNGLEAIEQARKTRPDVILMDIQMPELDGLEATRRIRADAELATIPIIALTALVMPGDRERCLAAGANEYISKPINSQELVEAIEAQLQGAENDILKGDR